MASVHLRSRFSLAEGRFSKRLHPMSSNRGTRAKLRIVGARPVDECDDAPDASAAPATAEEAERIRLELEMAQERRQMRRELAAKLVAEYRIRPMTIPVRALHTAYGLDSD